MPSSQSIWALDIVIVIVRSAPAGIEAHVAGQGLAVGDAGVGARAGIGAGDDPVVTGLVLVGEHDVLGRPGTAGMHRDGEDRVVTEHDRVHDRSLATPGFGQRTVIDALSSLFDPSWSLLEVMLAVLAMPFAQSSAWLDIVIVIVRSSPFGMSPKSQLRVSPAATLVSAQSPASVPLMTQL